MTVTFDAHSDGKIIVPDEPLSLPANTRLRVTVTSVVDPAGAIVARAIEAALSGAGDSARADDRLLRFLEDVQRNAAGASDVVDTPPDSLRLPLLRTRS